MPKKCSITSYNYHEMVVIVCITANHVQKHPVAGSLDFVNFQKLVRL